MTTTSPSTSKSTPPTTITQPAKLEYVAPKYSCPLCSEHHYAFHCTLFKGYTPTQRNQYVLTQSLCKNCLKPGHSPEVCRSTYKCKECRGQHNSLLHEEEIRVSSPALGSPSIAAAAVKDGLVMTAQVLVTGTNGITE